MCKGPQRFLPMFTHWTTLESCNSLWSSDQQTQCHLSKLAHKMQNRRAHLETLLSQNLHSNRSLRKFMPGEANGNPLEYSCRGNPMDRGAWQATVHGVTKSQTPQRLNNNKGRFIHVCKFELHSLEILVHWSISPRVVRESIRVVVSFLKNKIEMALTVSKCAKAEPVSPATDAGVGFRVHMGFLTVTWCCS